MFSLRFRFEIILATCLAMLWCPAFGYSQDVDEKQEDKEEEKLPAAADLMDNYIKVTGGKEAYEKIKTRVSKGKMNLAGNSGTLVVYQKAPNLMYMAFDLKGIGQFETGTDGKIVWENNPVTGAKLQSGVEKAKFLRSAAMNSDYEWRKYYKEAKTVAEEKVNSSPAYKVELITNEGSMVTRYFDKKSGLVVKMSQKVETDMGEFEVTSYVSGYKKVDGILTAHRVRQNLLNLEIEMELNSIETNVEVPANRFDLPEAVQKLLKKL